MSNAPRTSSFWGRASTTSAGRVHAGNGWLFTAPNGGWEYPAFLAVAAIAQALLGDGAFALRRGLVPGRLATA